MELDDERLFQFCQLNRELRIERSAEGDLIIMPPGGGSSGRGNAKLTTLLDTWASRDGAGQVFDSSTEFILDNGAARSPDVAWVRNDRLDRLTDDKWEKFLPLCPDFVIELRSPSDSLPVIQRKMEEYRANGARLGWLLDSARREVHVYIPHQSVDLLKNPSRLSGEPVLHGFVLNLAQIWTIMQRPSAR